MQVAILRHKGKVYVECGSVEETRAFTTHDVRGQMAWSVPDSLAWTLMKDIHSTQSYKDCLAANGVDLGRFEAPYKTFQGCLFRHQPPAV